VSPDRHAPAATGRPDTTKGGIRHCCGEALLAAIRREGLDSVEWAFSCPVTEDMTKPHLGHRGRARLHLQSDDGQRHVLFLKRYEREPFSWRLRRWWTYGRRRSPGGVELDNIVAANAIGLPTIREALCGEQFDRWGVRRSYILMTAVPGEALEQCAEGFLAAHADCPDVIAEFTRRLAALVRDLHVAGFVHRDLYSSHVFLADSGEGFELHLIDLARMFLPRRRRFRWRVKDLAQLRHSMPPQWVEAHWEAFLRAYLGDPGPRRLRRWRRAVERKVAYMRWRLDRRARRKAADPA